MHNAAAGVAAVACSTVRFASKPTAVLTLQPQLRTGGDLVGGQRRRRTMVRAATEIAPLGLWYSTRLHARAPAIASSRSAATSWRMAACGGGRAQGSSALLGGQGGSGGGCTRAGQVERAIWRPLAGARCVRALQMAGRLGTSLRSCCTSHPAPRILVCICFCLFAIRALHRLSTKASGATLETLGTQSHSSAASWPEEEAPLDDADVPPLLSHAPPLPPAASVLPPLGPAPAALLMLLLTTP